MISKNIVFTAPNVAEVLDQEVFAPEENEVQVRLDTSSISSGTERANISGELDISFSQKFTEAIFPRYGGYSSAGVITAVGSKVKNFEIGDRVVLRWSKHSQIQNIAAENVSKLPNEVSFKSAALMNIATFPLAALRKCRLEIGESAIVMGMGILGLIAIPLLRNAGAAPIIAVDPVAEKRKKALELGADYAFDPFDANFVDNVKNVTNGGVKVAIEVTGNGKALDQVLDCMAQFGRVALLGCTRNSDFTIDYYRKVHGPGVSLIGAHTLARPQIESYPGYWTQKDDIQTLIKLESMGRISLEKMVEETYSPEDAPNVYTRLVTEQCFPMVQFDWKKL